MDLKEYVTNGNTFGISSARGSGGGGSGVAVGARRDAASFVQTACRTDPPPTVD